MQELTTQPLRDLADELVFTTSRTDADALAKQLGAPLIDLLVKTDLVDDAYKKILRAITKADAAAAGARDEVETWCAEFQKVMLGIVKQDRSDPLFLKYFRDAASTIQSMDIEGQLNWLQGIVKPLSAEPDKAMAAQGVVAAGLLKKWLLAMEQQNTAVKANEQDKVTVRDPLRKAINNARSDLYADLTKLKTKHKKTKKWVDSFFRSKRSTSKKQVHVAE